MFLLDGITLALFQKRVLFLLVEMVCLVSLDMVIINHKLIHDKSYISVLVKLSKLLVVCAIHLYCLKTIKCMDSGLESVDNLVFLSKKSNQQVILRLPWGLKILRLPALVQMEIIVQHYLLADGSLYTWGRGFGRASDECIPHLFDAPFSFSQIALGWNHALLLTQGNIFMLGGDRHGVLGDPQKISSLSNESGKSKEDMLQQITELIESKVVQIGAGSEHSALVTDDERVMTWGWGEHGQLGLGDTSDKTVPHIVSLGNRSTETNAVSRVYCGSGFSFVLSNI